VKVEKKLLAERTELKAQLDSTKKYIGSIVTTADPKERESKELKMIKEMTNTIIEKDMEISRLRDDLRQTQSEETSLYKRYLNAADELSRTKGAKDSVVALLKHMTDKSGFKKLADLVQEFVNRLDIATDSQIWYDKIVDNFATLQVFIV
jgi:hypothetical protein